MYKISVEIRVLTIMAEESADISNKEQVVICKFYLVDVDLQPHEEFIV